MVRTGCLQRSQHRLVVRAAKCRLRIGQWFDDLDLFRRRQTVTMFQARQHTRQFVENEGGPAIRAPRGQNPAGRAGWIGNARREHVGVRHNPQRCQDVSARTGGRILRRPLPRGGGVDLGHALLLEQLGDPVGRHRRVRQQDGTSAAIEPAVSPRVATRGERAPAPGSAPKKMPPAGGIFHPSNTGPIRTAPTPCRARRCRSFPTPAPWAGPAWSSCRRRWRRRNRRRWPDALHAR